MNLDKILYWISTGIMLAIFAFSAWMYITNYAGVCSYFPQKGFPNWIVAPLAAAKILGIIAILTKKSRMLKEWAYAGFFFDAVLAFGRRSCLIFYFLTNLVAKCRTLFEIKLPVFKLFGRFFSAKCPTLFSFNL